MISFWEKNLTFFEKLDRNINILPQSFCNNAQGEESVQLIRKEGFYPTLRVRKDDGQWLTLHSPIDPYQEARKLIPDLSASRDKIMVILGLGLGYHLFEIMHRTPLDQILVIVEPNQAVWAQMLHQFDLTELLQRPDVYWLIRSNEKDILTGLSKIQLRHHLAEFFPSLIRHPSNANLHFMAI